MMNQEGLPNPWDEDSVRLDMRDMLIGEHSRAEIDAFFDKKISLALNKIFHPIHEIIEDGVDLSLLSATLDGEKFRYHESLLGNDFYSARSVGILVTRKDTDLVIFYYYFYAMTLPNMLSGPYSVFAKTNGKFDIIHEINALTVDDLFENIKRALKEAKPFMDEA